MDQVRFIFWEAIKGLSLAFLGLLAAKAASGLTASHAGIAKNLKILKGVLYFGIAALVILGARAVGYEVAAETYFWAAQDSLASLHVPQAYTNAVQAVRLRPGTLRFWRTLEAAKAHMGQFESVLDDEPTLETTFGGSLNEEDIYRFAACYFFLAQYDKSIGITQRLVQQFREYAAPYVLQGMAWAAQRNYVEAERSYQGVIRMYPNHQAAVEGLARVYFLAGKRGQALALLDETAKQPYAPEARERFEALKALYAQ